jgi:hypothetical protein
MAHAMSGSAALRGKEARRAAFELAHARYGAIRLRRLFPANAAADACGVQTSTSRRCAGSSASSPTPGSTRRTSDAARPSRPAPLPAPGRTGTGAERVRVRRGNADCLFPATGAAAHAARRDTKAVKARAERRMIGDAVSVAGMA